jgi:hypothetical protein
VLVIFAALAACSKRDDSAGTDLLSQDRALVARLEVNQETRQLPLPTACGKLAIAAQPAVENKNKAEDLTRQAQDAEMHGDIKDARSLLSRASDLDATNKSAAYHLGRTSETLGDSTAALTAYCRYLALTPTTSESLEARQRVAQLSKSVTHVSAGSISDSTSIQRSVAVAPTRRATREQPTVRRRVAVSAPVQQSAPMTGERASSSTSVAANAPDESPTASEPVAAPRPAESTGEPATVAGDVGASERPAPPVEQPSTAPRSTSRSSARTQGAVIGAATGAIIGAATGRSVKSSVIGAAAGGLLGAVVGPSVRPMGRGIVPYARGN